MSGERQLKNRGGAVLRNSFDMKSADTQTDLGTALDSCALRPVTSASSSGRLRVREITEADHEQVARLLAKGFQRPVWYYAQALSRLSQHARRLVCRNTVS